MSGRATLTTVTSRSSMNVAIETRTRVHHLASIGSTLKNRKHRLWSDCQVAELLPDPLIEAGARQLGEATDRLDEADFERGAGGELGELAAVDRDFDRLATGGVADMEDVTRGD